MTLTEGDIMAATTNRSRSAKVQANADAYTADSWPGMRDRSDLDEHEALIRRANREARACAEFLLMAEDRDGQEAKVCHESALQSAARWRELQDRALVAFDRWVRGNPLHD